MVLFKYFKREEKHTISNSSSLLSKNDVEQANKAVVKALKSTSKALQVKYNSYMPTKIGKHATENSAKMLRSILPQSGPLA